MSTVGERRNWLQGESRGEPAGADPRRWRGLALLGLLQFMWYWTSLS